MTSRERADVAAERFARTSQDSYQKVLDHMMAFQERTRASRETCSTLSTESTGSRSRPIGP